MVKKIQQWLGLDDQDPYIKDYIEESNMRSAKYMCTFVIFVEAWMILRIVKMLLFGGEERTIEWIVVHFRLYIVLLAASVAMMWYALTYAKGRKRTHGVTLVWKVAYTAICTGFGMYVSYLDYIKGEQMMSFLTMILFVACLLVWRPFVSLILLTVSYGTFYYICDKAVPATIATNVNMFTTYVAMLMISIGNYRQRLSEALKDKGLEELSNRDDITNISNMRHFRKKARRMFESAAGSGRQLSLIYFDIINFKAYNERYGFSGGNTLLVKIAELLRDTFPGGEIARFSDDHFAVLTDEENPEDKVEKLQDKVCGIRGDVFLRLKAGIYRTDGMKADGSGVEDISILCDRARFAIKSIKEKADTSYCFYDEKLDEIQRRKHYIVSHIDEAVKKGYIKVYYQPIMDAETGCVCALEALARWADPDLGMLSPGEFIDTLEEFRLIHKLDACVIEQVLRDHTEAGENGHEAIPISVNLSRLDFELCDVAQMINDIVAKYNVPREYLEIEITESALSRNAQALDSAIESLKMAKYNLWLDDFGAGYSSFNVLKDYSFDVLKIDMKFLENFGKSDRLEPIIKSIIALCKELKMISLAEGVETQEEYEFLKENGCNRMQGYLISRPAPIEEINVMFGEGKLKAAK
ncbi:MAG: EAL domain-containing protein [Lachnospiraceae bacterium]|nr:EAL domain-containing protein [Lachnospiraceae bacterium]